MCLQTETNLFTDVQTKIRIFSINNNQRQQRTFAKPPYDRNSRLQNKRKSMKNNIWIQEKMFIALLENQYKISDTVIGLKIDHTNMFWDSDIEKKVVFTLAIFWNYFFVILYKIPNVYAQLFFIFVKCDVLLRQFLFAFFIWNCRRIVLILLRRCWSTFICCYLFIYFLFSIWTLRNHFNFDWLSFVSTFSCTLSVHSGSFVIVLIFFLKTK